MVSLGVIGIDAKQIYNLSDIKCELVVVLLIVLYILKFHACKSFLHVIKQRGHMFIFTT